MASENVFHWIKSNHELIGGRVLEIGARHYAKACALRGIPLIHISSDYDFNGEKDGACSGTPAGQDAPVKRGHRPGLKGARRLRMGRRDRRKFVNSPGEAISPGPR